MTQVKQVIVHLTINNQSSLRKSDVNNMPFLDIGLFKQIIKQITLLVTSINYQMNNSIKLSTIN